MVKKYFLKNKKYLVREKRSCTFATPKRSRKEDWGGKSCGDTFRDWHFELRIKSCGATRNAE